MHIKKEAEKIGKIQHDHYETFLVYLVILLLTNANDIHLNSGPRTEREYLCGTCDKTVSWEERGVICETCDQWYHAGCQNIHTLSYDQLGNSELNILVGIASSVITPTIAIQCTTIRVLKSLHP
jgi:hypothetical protein